MSLSFDKIDLFLVSPLIVMFITSLIPILFKVINKNKEAGKFINYFIPLAGLVVTILLLVTIIIHNVLHGSGKLLFSGALIIDGVAIFSSIIILVITMLSVFMINEHSTTDKKLFSETIFLLFCSALGMVLTTWSNDLIMMFISIELMSLSLYLLINISNETKFTKEASIKYFVLGSLASALFLYGLSFIFGLSGFTYLNELSLVVTDLMRTNRLFVIGSLLVAIGLAFKVSIFPFHTWTADVYEGSSTPLAGFMATAAKIAGFVALLRFITTGFIMDQESRVIVDVLQWLAVLTMLVGNLTAILQKSIKRMLAFSSVAHSGFALIGVIVSGLAGGEAIGSSGVLFYVYSYAIMTIGAFAFIAIYEKQEDTVVTFDTIKGLAYRKPYLALAMTIFMLSLAGIPPTVGFFGKFFILSAAMKQGFYWLAIWGVLNSVIGIYYYLRPVVYMYMNKESSVIPEKGMSATKMTILISSVLVIALGLGSNLILEIVKKSITNLY